MAEMTTLAVLIDQFIQDHGYKYTFIADKIGMSKGTLYNFLRKKNFTIDDANRILSAIGYKVDYDIKPIVPS